MPKLKRVLIADDHGIVRSSMKLIIQRNYFDVIIDEAVDGITALKMIKENNYDLLLFDLFMPNSKPFSTVELIGTIQPNLPILIVSMCSEKVFGKRLFELGIKGYVNKKESIDRISEALKTVTDGKTYMSPLMKDIIIDLTLNQSKQGGFDSLTNRELEITLLFLKGSSIKEIGDLLAITASTVGTYKSRIFEKLDVSNLVELVQYATSFEGELG